VEAFGSDRVFPLLLLLLRLRVVVIAGITAKKT
jgi:hypothetical protein